MLVTYKQLCGLFCLLVHKSETLTVKLVEFTLHWVEMEQYLHKNTC